MVTDASLAEEFTKYYADVLRYLPPLRRWVFHPEYKPGVEIPTYIKHVSGMKFVCIYPDYMPRFAIDFIDHKMKPLIAEKKTIDDYFKSGSLSFYTGKHYEIYDLEAVQGKIARLEKYHNMAGINRLLRAAKPLMSLNIYGQ